MLSTIAPKAGRLLISEPFMMDPNFRRSVILLTEHTEAGAFGFVLNQQNDFLLGDILPDTSYSEIPLYTGGPVGENTLHFIHQCPDKIPGGIEIRKGVFWGGDFAVVIELINSYHLTEHEIRFFIGYSGWTAGQLETEIKDDSWIVAENIGKDVLFGRSEDSLWKDMVVGLGQRYAHIANFPVNPALN